MSARTASLVSLLVMGLLSKNSVATTRIVPDQFPTVQAAMVASSPSGDSVLVRPGTYMEAVNYLGKDIVLKSMSGPEVTIIDAAGRGAAAVYMQGLGSGARLEGFTIMHGVGSVNGLASGGGGVHSSESHGAGPTIEGNWIKDNTASYGGGILIWGPAQVLRNRVTNNQAVVHGGGIAAHHVEVGTDVQVISENEIFGNRTAGGVNQQGGGLQVSHLQVAFVTRNVIACNESDRAGGCYFNGGPSGRFIENNTIFANWGRSGVGGVFLLMNASYPPLELTKNAIVFNFGGGVECQFQGLNGTVGAECNDIFGNNPDIVGDECGDVIGVNNNIREDPLFGSTLSCPPPDGAFCLTHDSPLLPENSPPGCGLIGARGLCSQIGIADETPAPGADGNRVSSQPNPFATRTTLVIDLVSPADIDLRITSAMGRVVAEQSLGSLHAGRHRWTWDGRDTEGHEAPAGVYYAEVRMGGRSVVTRLMILR
jgi:hypothetical protein